MQYHDCSGLKISPSFVGGDFFRFAAYAVAIWSMSPSIFRAMPSSCIPLSLSSGVLLRVIVPAT